MLARWARDRREQAIEPGKTSEHSAPWIYGVENDIPAGVWHKPIADIEPPELSEALGAVTAPERARRVEAGARVTETVQHIRQRLDAVFEDAIFRKRCTTKPAAAVRRKMRETLSKKKPASSQRCRTRRCRRSWRGFVRRPVRPLAAWSSQS